MVKPEQLEKIATQISNDYLERQIPLTDGLEKVSTMHGLNQNQVYRVAEAANVKTYLELMKTAQDDSYIEFDIADPIQVIGSRPSQEKTASGYSDYLTAPKKDWAFELLQEKKASLRYEDEKQEKVAGTNKPEPA